MINSYLLSVSFILIALTISYFAGLLTINLIQRYTSDNSSNINFPIIPIGFGIISLFSKYLYFYLNISSEIIFWSILIIVILSVIFNYFFFQFKKIELSEIIFLFIISSILIIFLLYKGEQFYIFRGNHWDSINYLSVALTIKDFSYLEIFKIREANIYPIESYIYTGDIIYRPLAKLILSFFLNFKLENYFFQYWIFKIFLICNIFISCRYFFKNFNIKYSLIYSFVFIFSFWFLYIIEIDAISHLASFSFFILGISFVINNQKNKIFLDRNNEILFLLSSVLVLLFYPEIFIIYTYLIFIYLFFKLGIKTIFYEIYPKKLKIILVFLILTIPTYHLTYNVIYLNLISGIKNSNVDWWGYYGAFILGKIDNFLLLDIGYIKDTVVLKGVNQETLTNILNFLNKQNINHVFLNIIPSFFGLYHTTNLNINYYLNLIFTIFLNFILIKIVYINFKDFFLNKNFKNTFLTSVAFSFFVIIIVTIFLRLNLWMIVKIYSYLSFFIFIFLINNNNLFVKKKFNSYLSQIIILSIVSFPIYKYSGNDNNGIGKIDNFPSILNIELKNKIDWEINNLKIKNCELIYFNNQNEQILNYLSVKLKFEGFEHINQATFKNNSELNNLANCELVLEKRSFILKDVY